MTALVGFGLFGVQKVLNLSCVTAAFAMEIFGGTEDVYDENLHRIKPHPGQLHIAQVIRGL
jgi:histidine ammonia-lyase